VTSINYDNCRFRGVLNYDDGDLTRETLFVYHQEGNIVWGECAGGGVTRGSLVGIVGGDGLLQLLWQYASHDGRLVGGTCVSRPEVLADGRLRLHEEWAVTYGGNQKGSSVIEEIEPRQSAGTRSG
jgi:hypothetical protein